MVRVYFLGHPLYAIPRVCFCKGLRNRAEFGLNHNNQNSSNRAIVKYVRMLNTSIEVVTNGPVAIAGSTCSRLKNIGIRVPIVAAINILTQMAYDIFKLILVVDHINIENHFNVG